MFRHGNFGPIEWAAVRRPVPGEEVCGDHPIALDVGDGAALFGVIDGLGHGAAAATAALRAVETVEAGRSEPLDVVMQLLPPRADRNTRCGNDIGPRGLRNRHPELDRDRQRDGRPRRQAPDRRRGAVVGAAGRWHRRIPDATDAVDSSGVDDARATCLSSRATASPKIIWTASTSPRTRRRSPKQLVGRYGKETDDALVLAARHRGSS